VCAAQGVESASSAQLRNNSLTAEARLTATGEFVVGESGERPHHGGEDPRLDTKVDLGDAVQHESLVESSCQLEHVGEVARLGTAQQHREFASGQFLWVKGRPGGESIARCTTGVFASVDRRKRMKLLLS
jgi:hypothetical protein